MGIYVVQVFDWNSAAAFCLQDSGRSSHPLWQTDRHLSCPDVGQGGTRCFFSALLKSLDTRLQLKFNLTVVVYHLTFDLWPTRRMGTKPLSPLDGPRVFGLLSLNIKQTLLKLLKFVFCTLCLPVIILSLQCDWLFVCVHPQALDLLLDKMKRAGFDFSRVRALSGSGQVRQEHLNIIFSYNGLWEQFKNALLKYY